METHEGKIQGHKVFKLKLEGTLEDKTRISPETLGIEKFAQVFAKFKKLVENSITEDKRTTIDKVNFRYEEGSAVLMSDLPLQAHDSIQAEVRYIEEGHPISLTTSKITASILELKQIVDGFGEDAVLTIGSGAIDDPEGESYMELTPQTEFEQFQNVIVETELIAYGKLYSVGGKNPNIHLSTDDMGTLIISVNEMEARELAEYLYQEIGIRLAVEQNLLTHEILSPVYKGRLAYSAFLDEEKFKKDKEVGTYIWKDVDSVAWVRELRDGKV